MAFRKRNVGIPGPSNQPPGSATEKQSESSASPLRREPGSSTSIPSLALGIRPSPLDGRLTTSTGTQSLDNLLAGHAGLALGCSILLEESGTTDYAGTLLRYYAAEGVVQGHCVHVVGVGEQWGRDLPGLVAAGGEEFGKSARATDDKEKMKIAWRYERLGEFGGGGSGSRAPPSAQRSLISPTQGEQQQGAPAVFCHSFDLTKRLTLPSPTAINFIPIRPVAPTTSPFLQILQALSQQISSSAADTIHRLIIPTMLSPAFYPPHSSTPEHNLQFLHSLRSLLRQHSNRFTAMISLPLTLYPRSTGLVRWMEILSDGVIELVPFPHNIDTGPSLTTSGATTTQDEKPQGIAKVHCLPIFHERGGGPGGERLGDDFAFTVNRRKFVIKPFSLPPVEGDTEAQRGEVEGSKATKIDIEF